MTEYPGMLYERMWRQPADSLSIERCGDCVRVSCGPQYRVECFADHSWHFLLDSLDGAYRVDLWHRPSGCPLWYGREIPSYLTQHSITYGYNWSGVVTGEIVLNGRAIRQWHAYPHILPRELYSDDPKVVACENKFDTL